MLAIGRAAGVLACALLLSGCITPPDFDTGNDIRSVFQRQTTPQPIRFVTTRCAEPMSAGAPGSTAELLSKRCWDVAPKTGEIPALQLGIANGPTVHCGGATIDVTGKDSPTASTVRDFQSAECDSPFDSMRDAIAATACKCAMIFVHGYNTTLPYALKRTGQVTLDVGYQGVPILFSFGAAGRIGDYVNDIEAAELSVPALHRLLVALAHGRDGTPLRIDVVAHSLGTRLSLRAITEGDAPMINQMVAAAPDIDPAAFLQLAGKGLSSSPPRVQRLTVYTSEYDTAMEGSVYQHNGRTRLGLGLPVGVSSGVAHADIVNASATGTTGYGHSYFAESPIVITDIKAALSGEAASSRAIVWTADKGWKIPCPAGDSCEPSIYERFVRWFTRLVT